MYVAIVQAILVQATGVFSDIVPSLAIDVKACHFLHLEL